MKNLLLGIVFGLMGMMVSCQDKCKDIIYPVESERLIFNCCIYKVSPGNKVYYRKGNDSAMVIASSILKDGNKIILNKYQSYDFTKTDKTLLKLENKENGQYHYMLAFPLMAQPSKKYYFKPTFSVSIAESMTFLGTTHGHTSNSDHSILILILTRCPEL